MDSKSRLTTNLSHFKKGKKIGKTPHAVMALRKRRLPNNVQGKSFMYGAGVMRDEAKDISPT